MKTLRQVLSQAQGSLAPKSEGDKAFVNLHKVQVTHHVDDKVADNNDKVFKGVTKPWDRWANRFGYNPGQDLENYDKQAQMDDESVYDDDEWGPDEDDMKEEALSEMPKITARGQTFDDKTQKWSVNDAEYDIKGSNKSALRKGLERVKKQFPGHKEYEVKIKEDTMQEDTELLSEAGFSRAHFQAGVNHVLSAPDSLRPHLLKAHSDFYASQHPGFKPERFASAVAKGKIYDEKGGLPKLSRKHFQAAADYIKGMDNPEAKNHMHAHMQSMGKRSNPQFKSQTFAKAAGMNEELQAEVDKQIITELSKKTLGSYIKKAMSSKEMHSQYAKTLPIGKTQHAHNKLARQRFFGIHKAVGKLTKEDTEITEVSKKTLGSYLQKAKSSAVDLDDKKNAAHDAGNMDAMKHFSSLQSKRHKGITTATGKMNEEIEQELNEWHPKTWGWNNEKENDGKKYNIVRFHKEGGRKTVARGVSLSAAQSHCKHPETSSSTCKGAAGKRYTRAHGHWFDGYEKG